MNSFQTDGISVDRIITHLQTPDTLNMHANATIQIWAQESSIPDIQMGYTVAYINKQDNRIIQSNLDHRLGISDPPSKRMNVSYMIASILPNTRDQFPSFVANEPPLVLDTPVIMGEYGIFAVMKIGSTFVFIVFDKTQNPHCISTYTVDEEERSDYHASGAIDHVTKHVIPIITPTKTTLMRIGGPAAEWIRAFHPTVYTASVQPIPY